jgi:4-amino-4-deoxychorismate lyase
VAQDLGDFGLIETLLWTRDQGYGLRAEHERRLLQSAAALGFEHDAARIAAALDAAVAKPEAARLRVRLELARSGAVSIAAVAIEPVAEGAIWRVALAKQRFDSREPLLRHKTTRRALYEEELAGSGADEVLFLNERDEVCEGARTNVFLPRSETLATPPVSCGLLPGTLRAHLLRRGAAREEHLGLEDFEDAEFFVGNSVRGLVRARLA